MTQIRSREQIISLGSQSAQGTPATSGIRLRDVQFNAPDLGVEKEPVDAINAGGQMSRGYVTGQQKKIQIDMPLFMVLSPATPTPYTEMLLAASGFVLGTGSFTGTMPNRVRTETLTLPTFTADANAGLGLVTVFWSDRQRRLRMSDAAGSCTISGEGGGRVDISCELMGSTATELGPNSRGAVPVPEPQVLPPVMKGATLAVQEYSADGASTSALANPLFAHLHSFEFSSGGQVTRPQDLTAADGYGGSFITSFQTQLTLSGIVSAANADGWGDEGVRAISTDTVYSVALTLPSATPGATMMITLPSVQITSYEPDASDGLIKQDLTCTVIEGPTGTAGQPSIVFRWNPDA